MGDYVFPLVSDDDIARAVDSGPRRPLSTSLPVTLPGVSNEPSLPISLSTGREGGNAKTSNSTAPSIGTTTSKYPWAEWLDGKAHVIVRGTHYSVPTRNMVVQLHNRGLAQVETMYVYTETLEGTAGIYFQFYKTKEERDERRVQTKNEERLARERYANVRAEDGRVDG